MSVVVIRQSDNGDKNTRRDQEDSTTLFKRRKIDPVKSYMLILASRSEFQDFAKARMKSSATDSTNFQPVEISSTQVSLDMYICYKISIGMCKYTEIE